MKKQYFINANIVDPYNSVNENNISGLLSTASSKGLQTSEYASISSPFDMFFTFHQGSSDQGQRCVCYGLPRQNFR